MQTLRIFISSPGDVADERQIAGKVIERLQGKYWSFVRLDDVFWEQKVIRSTAHYQDELVNPGDCEMVVGILWSRLGSLMPEKFRKSSGERYDSGTEWELEMAFEAYGQSLSRTGDPMTAKPDIVIYRRNQTRPKQEDPQEDARSAEQIEKLESYFRENYWFPDGTIKRPITNYATLVEFETVLSRNLEELILRQIPGLKAGFEPPPISGSPFKGLQAFDFADSDRYFGRNREIREIQQRLITNAGKGLPFVLIYGGSGYGKSSLMRAGLAPVLTRSGGSSDEIQGWRRVPFQPAKGDGTLCERLARALFQSPTPVESENSRLHRNWPLTGLAEVAEYSSAPVRDVSSFTRHFTDDENRVFDIAAIVGTLESLNRHLLLEIDQLEEIFTVPGIDDTQRTDFLRTIGDLCLSGRVWTIATMRSEFFPRIAEQPALRDLVGKDRGYILPPPDRQSLREIIRYPALAARLDFERRVQDIEIGGEKAKHDYLHDQILADAESSPDALPLLEFTLQQLYEEKRDTLLTWESYAKAGGLKGAIAQRATRVYQALPLIGREARHRIFAALIYIDPTRGTVTRQRAPLDTLKTSAESESFLDAFLGAHLLVTDEDALTHQPVITLAHEALISHWDELSTWIKDHQGDLLARQRLREQTNLWQQNDRKKSYLLSEARLAEAARVAERNLFVLTSEEKNFLTLSRKRSQGKLRLLQVSVSVFAMIALVAVILGVVAKRETQKAEASAERAALQTERAEKEEAKTRRQIALGDMKQAIVAAQPYFNPPMQRIASHSLYRRPEALAYLARAVRYDPELQSAGRLLIHLLAQGGYFLPLEGSAKLATPTGIDHTVWRESDPLGKWNVQVSNNSGTSVLHLKIIDEDGAEKNEILSMSNAWANHSGPIFSQDLRKFVVGGWSGGEFGFSGEWVVFDWFHYGEMGVRDPAAVPTPVGFSPDGTLLAVERGTIQLFLLTGGLGGPHLLEEFDQENEVEGLSAGSLVWLEGGRAREFQVGKKIRREVGRSLQVTTFSYEEADAAIAQKNGNAEPLLEANETEESLGNHREIPASEPYVLIRHPKDDTVVLKFREPGGTRLELRSDPWKQSAPLWTFLTTDENAEVMFHPNGHLLLVKDGDSGAGFGPLFLIDPVYGFVLAAFHANVGLRMTADGRNAVTGGLDGQDGMMVPLVQASSTVPAWLADLAEGMGGMTITADGAVVKMTPEARWKAIRSSLSSAAVSKDSWSEFLPYFISADEGGDIAVPEGYKVEQPKEPAVPIARPERAEPEKMNPTPESLFALGEEHFNGKGRPIDRAAAYPYYRLAAEAGLPAAQHKLGVCYALGAGVDINQELTVAWYQKAAEQGYAEAQYDLGVRYFLGKGVAKDPDKGLELYRKSAAQGYKEAIDALDRIQK